jgi:hypothetical protein
VVPAIVACLERDYRSLVQDSGLRALPSVGDSRALPVLERTMTNGIVRPGAG